MLFHYITMTLYFPLPDNKRELKQISRGAHEHF